MALLIAAGVAALVIVVAVLAARDMDRRGRSGEVYAIAILFVFPLGILMWALDHRRRPVDEAAPDVEPAEPEPAGPAG